MGKIFIFIIAVFCVLSGCSKAVTKADNSGFTKNYKIPAEEKEYKDKAIAAMEAKDIDTMKSLFSKNARDSIEDFDFKIALLMKKYRGDLISAKYDRRLPKVFEDKERGIKRVETYYVVENERDGEVLNARFMYLQIVIQNDEDPNEIGISSMMFSPEVWEITMDDSNRGYYLWVDNPLWNHIDPDEVMPSESESR